MRLLQCQIPKVETDMYPGIEGLVQNADSVCGQKQNARVVFQSSEKDCRAVRDRNTDYIADPS